MRRLPPRLLIVIALAAAVAAAVVWWLGLGFAEAAVIGAVIGAALALLGRLVQPP